MGVSSSWDESKWYKKCKEVEHGINDFTRVERSEGIWDVKIRGTFEPIHQGSTWREDEEKMTSVVPWLGNWCRTSSQNMGSEMAPEECAAMEGLAGEDSIISSPQGRTGLTKTGKETGGRSGRSTSR